MSRVSRPDASRRLVVALLALLLVAAGRVSSEEERPLFLHFRERVKAAGAAGGFSVVEKTVVWQPSRTALIICDMWDRHWCQGASRRVAGMAKRMNRVVQAARERGVFVIHAPSDTMDSYRDTPQRRLAREAPRAENLPAGIDSWCSLESRKEAALPIDDSDGGCDCQPRCKSHRAWSRQIESIDIAPGDAISDRGSEIWNLLEARDIDNVCLLGVHTNMCVLGRPFGVRSLVKNGKNVALVRDLTDSMYNPRKPPFVHHRRGTEFVIQHIEKY